MEDKMIKVWRFEDAPEDFQALSGHGGDEDWLAFIPDYFENDWVGWAETGTAFGCCDVESHIVIGGTVRIGAHA